MPFAKCGDKSCRVIIDSGSCTSVVSTSKVKQLNHTTSIYPQTYRVAWVGYSSIPVTHRCQVPIKFGSHKNKLCYDMVPMDVGHIILGRP